MKIKTHITHYANIFNVTQRAVYLDTPLLYLLSYCTCTFVYLLCYRPHFLPSTFSSLAHRTYLLTHPIIFTYVSFFTYISYLLPTLAFLRTLATCAFRTFILTYPFYFLLSSPLSYFILFLFFLLFYVISYCNLLHTHTSCTLSRLLLHAHNLSIVII